MLWPVDFPCTKFNKFNSCGPCLGFVVDRGPETEQMFGNQDDLHVLPPTADLLDILVLAQVFESRGQAKKNWQGQKRAKFVDWADPLPIKDIPIGWTETVVRSGGTNRALFIWNQPTP